MVGGSKMAEKAENEMKKELKVFFRALPLQILIALSLCIGVLYGGFYYAPHGALPQPSSGDLSAKMLYTFRCLLFPGLFLWVVITIVGLRRIDVGAVNPLTGNEAAMEPSKKCLRNTLEQTLFFVVFAIFLTNLLDREEMKFVLLSTIVFITARVLFWYGFSIHPAYREAGIIASFTVVGTMLVTSTYLVCARRFMLSTTSATVFSAAVNIGLMLFPEVCRWISGLYQ